MSIRRRLGFLGSASMLAATSLVCISSGSAQASALDWTQCPVGYLCVWTDANGQGRFAQFRSGSRFIDEISGYNFDNKISSLKNRTDQYWCVYDDVNYYNPKLEIWPQENIARLSSVGWNDRISSLRIGTC
jgi:hypothetical protein